MKKLLLAVTIWASITVSGFAQAGYDLEFFDFRLEENAVQKDTVYMGCTYDLKGGMRNNGPNGFPGFTGMVLNVYVATDTTGLDHSTLVPEFTMAAFDLPSIPANGSANISRPFYVSDDYFSVDSGNIVIVWPSDTYQDDNQENNFYHLPEVWASDSITCSSGMSETNGTLTFGMYPNPANNVLHLNFGVLARDGELSIMDMLGHTVYTTPVNKGEVEMTMPLPSGSLFREPARRR
jgi:hypothetical protein